MKPTNRATPKPKSMATPRRRKRAQYQPEDRYDRPMFWVTAAGVIAVAFSVAISAWVAFIMVDQLKSMNAQLDLMQTQQRPWVAVRMVEGSGSVDFRPDSLLNVAFEVDLKNVGEVVATNLVEEYEVVFADPISSARSDKLSGYADAILDGQARLCESVARRDGNALGASVFPDDTVRTKHIVWIKELPPERDFGVIVVGCIAYRSHKGGEPRLTPIAYHLEPSGEAGALRMRRFRRDDLAKGEGVDVERSVFGNAKAN